MWGVRGCEEVGSVREWGCKEVGSVGVNVVVLRGSVTLMCHSAEKKGEERSCQ